MSNAEEIAWLRKALECERDLNNRLCKFRDAMNGSGGKVDQLEAEVYSLRQQVRGLESRISRREKAGHRKIEELKAAIRETAHDPVTRSIAEEIEGTDYVWGL